MRNTSVRRSMGLAGVALVSVAALVGAQTLADRATDEPSPQARQAIEHGKALSLAFRATAKQVLPSVVTIETRQKVAEVKKEKPNVDFPRERGENPFKGTPFEDFFDDRFGDSDVWKHFREMPDSRRGPGQNPRGMGSGVVIDGSGIILTNNHVVAGGDEVVVRLSDGREFTAAEVKTDPKTDLAIVRIEGAGHLQPAPLGDSDKMEIGDWVLALGQPFGLESTVTAGIISAKHRGIGITDRENFLQTDAAINPGNSGGPLVNLDGEVIGINTAISSRSGGNQGIGFAVPVNLARWVVQQLRDNGVVKRAYLGVGIQMVNQRLADQFGVAPRQGVVVTEVFEGTPAAKAGVQAGDVIVKFDGQRVSSPQELQVMVEKSPLGEAVAVEVVRDGKHTTLRFVPEAQPGDFGVRRGPSRGDDNGGNEEGLKLEKFGLELGEMDADVAGQLGLEGVEGVVITSVEDRSAADNVGLTAGMAITQISRRPVKSLADVREVMKDHQEGKALLLLVQDSAGSRFVVVKP